MRHIGVYVVGIRQAACTYAGRARVNVRMTMTGYRRVRSTRRFACIADLTRGELMRRGILIKTFPAIAAAGGTLAETFAYADNNAPH
jgi:hypothetical protein